MASIVVLSVRSIQLRSRTDIKYFYCRCKIKSLSPAKQEIKMRDIMTRLWKEEEGQDLVEYGLLVVLIALFAVVAMQGLANGISDAFSNATTQLTSST
jgi:pilus assembly protein Flp/PilA